MADDELAGFGDRTPAAQPARGASTEELGAQVYEDLRRIASGYFQREQPGITLQPTALVHEAYLNLSGQEQEEWVNRSQFLGVAATAMRRVLVDAARSRGRQKRGGGWERITLSGEITEDPDVDLLDLEAALEKLARVSERSVRIIELRYFAGMTTAEVADVLGVSRTIIVREWAKAKTFLQTLLEDGGAPDGRVEA